LPAIHWTKRWLTKHRRMLTGHIFSFNGFRPGTLYTVYHFLKVNKGIPRRYRGRIGAASVVNGLLIQTLDYDYRHRTLLHFQLQPELLIRMPPPPPGRHDSEVFLSATAFMQ
jgi:hypothetical protein